MNLGRFGCFLLTLVVTDSTRIVSLFPTPAVCFLPTHTAFIAKPGYKFVVSDFSAIEARVLSYLAGEAWRSKVFEEGGDIYCASASKMFHVPVVKHGVNGHLRQKGKVAANGRSRGTVVPH